MAKAGLKSYIKSMNGRCGDYVYYSVGKKLFVRDYVVPRNPGTEAQQKNRSLFASAMASWKLLNEAQKNRFRKRAARFNMLGHNLFIREYMSSSSEVISFDMEFDVTARISAPVPGTGTGQIRSDASPFCYRSPFAVASVPLYSPPF